MDHDSYRNTFLQFTMYNILTHSRRWQAFKIPLRRSDFAEHYRGYKILYGYLRAYVLIER